MLTERLDYLSAVGWVYIFFTIILLNIASLSCLLNCNKKMHLQFQIPLNILGFKHTLCNNTAKTYCKSFRSLTFGRELLTYFWMKHCILCNRSLSGFAPLYCELLSLKPTAAIKNNHCQMPELKKKCLLQWKWEKFSLRWQRSMLWTYLSTERGRKNANT